MATAPVVAVSHAVLPAVFLRRCGGEDSVNSLHCCVPFCLGREFAKDRALATPWIKEKLAEIEDQLTFATAEWPWRIALDRVKFARALIRVCRQELEGAEEFPVQPEFPSKDATRTLTWADRVTE